VDLQRQRSNPVNDARAPFAILHLFASFAINNILDSVVTVLASIISASTRVAKQIRLAPFGISHDNFSIRWFDQEWGQMRPLLTSR
jgi:hypothetical protein